MSGNDTKPKSPEELKIDKIIEEAKQTMDKLDADIRELSKRGTKELQLNPSGMPQTNLSLVKKGIEKLKESRESVRTNAILEGNKTADTLPAESQQSNRQKILDVLGTEKDKQEKANAFADNYAQSLGLTKLFNREAAQQEKSVSKFMKPQKDAGDKER